MSYRFKPTSLCEGPLPIVIEATPKLIKLLTPVRKRIYGRSDMVTEQSMMVAYPGVDNADIYLTFENGINTDISGRIIHTSLKINPSQGLIDHGEAPYYSMSFIVEHNKRLVEFDENMDLNQVKLVGFNIYNRHASAMAMADAVFGKK